MGGIQEFIYSSSRILPLWNKRNPIHHKREEISHGLLSHKIPSCEYTIGEFTGKPGSGTVFISDLFSLLPTQRAGTKNAEYRFLHTAGE